MNSFQVEQKQDSEMILKARRPFISRFLAGLLVLAFGALFFVYKMISSPTGFFRSFQDNQTWLFWMFGAIFLMMGLFIVLGAFRNLVFPFTCSLNRKTSTLRIWPVPFSEKGIFEIAICEVLRFEVIDSLKAWTDQAQFFKAKPAHEHGEWLKKFPQLMQFAQLKLEELKLRQSDSILKPKDMVPLDEPSHESNMAPKMLLRLRLKSNEFILLDWLGTFRPSELLEIAEQLNGFIRLSQ